jgi:hypothetical protein
MRTAFATAAVAATASASDLMAVPDFVAGFIYGLTGDNHLAEIEACYNGGEAIVNEAREALADIKAGSFIKGAKAFEQVVKEISPALASCENMGDDIKEIEAWAAVFKQPGDLAKELAKNWLLHKKKVKSDIQHEETDWAAGSYFNAGKDTANAVDVLVPFPKQTVGLDAMAVPDFVAGFIYQLTGDNQMTEIEQCFTGGQSLVTDAEAALAEIKAGSYIKGAEDVYKVVQDFGPALSNCQNMGDDLAEIEAWAQVFTEPGTLAKEASKNWLLHHRKVKADIAKEGTDWTSGDYFGAGADTAAAIELLVPFKPSDEVSMPIKAIPDFAAGFLYGMVGDNHLTEFETCFQSSEELITYADAFITDLEDFKIIAAFESFEKFLFHFQLDVQPCKNVSDDVAAIEQWAAIFKEPATLVETLGKHWLLHQKGIKQDIASEKADWSAGNYFKAGADIADAVTLAVGPVEQGLGDSLPKNMAMEFAAGYLWGDM